MTFLSDQLSRNRPLRIRKRDDLISVHSRGCEEWVVKDPVSLQYFRLHDDVYAVLQLLNGRRTAQEILQQFSRQRPLCRFGMRKLLDVVRMLHSMGLVLSDDYGQADGLHRQQRSRQQQQFLSGLLNILAIRFRGIDPAAESRNR